MRKRLSRVLLFIITLVWSSFVFSRPASASVFDWIGSILFAPQASESFNSAITEELYSSETSTFQLGGDLQMTAIVNIMGGGFVSGMAGGTDEEISAAEKIYGRGAVGTVQDGIVAMYQPPASSQTYLADLIYNSRLVPQAQAQGIGFTSLDPILSTWKVFRNVAYLFFVITFLIIGFMIMFRTKVGQAAVTAQQAIPNIIVALLAVSFSYAIAGLMIDLMYLLMAMLASLFSEGSEVMEGNVFSLIGTMFGGGLFSNTQQAVEQFMEDALNIGWVGEALSWLTSLTATMIVGLAILISTFKIFFELLKTYITIILQVVFSPIILMVGALPGKNTFSGWIKNLVGNLMMWPVVLICILVERMLTNPIAQLDNEQINSVYGGGFMPPFLLGQGQARVVPVLVGIGILLVIPEIMKQVKKVMGVDEGMFGALAGSAINQLKQGVPLGGRIGGAAAGSIAGGALGGLSGTVAQMPKVAGQLAQRDFGGALSSLGKGLVFGTAGGVKRGAQAGVNTTIAAEHSIGANQPDILNPITNLIDTGELPIKGRDGSPATIGIGKFKFGGLASETNKKRSAKRREVEDWIDLSKGITGKS